MRERRKPLQKWSVAPLFTGLEDLFEEPVFVQAILPLSMMGDGVAYAVAVQAQKPHRLDRSEVPDKSLNCSTRNLLFF